MIFDNLRDVPKENGIVIIGGGPAGISIALELEKKGISSTIFEAGDLEFNEKSQILYKGNTFGDEYPDLSISRLRQFGGTSGHWGGNCLELDEYDFKNWPISKKDLNNFRSDSYKILNIKGNFYKKKFNENLNTFNLNWSNVRFKKKYFKKIRNSKKIRLILNCPLIMMEGKNGVINEAIFFKGEKKKISGKYFVLATGGIENSRILLWIKKNNPNLLDDRMPIGKYWMDHPYHSVADGILFKLNFNNYLIKKNIKQVIQTECRYSFYFSPQKNFLEDQNIVNTSINIGLHDPKKSKNSFLNKLKCVAPNILNEKIFPNTYDDHYEISVSLLSDQKPSPENKITLSNSIDTLGIPTANLFWKRSELIRTSSRIIIEDIAKFFVKENLGRLAINQFLYTDENYIHENGYHHMGGTRMGNDIKTSVVDSNLKIHNTENLFVSGSSVFVSAGHAYPTLTIVQLSLRLADHISRLIK